METNCIIYTGAPWGPDAIQDATLTTNHATASYGIPVLVVEGQVYGRDDLPADYLLIADKNVAALAVRAGYPVAGWRCPIISHNKIIDAWDPFEGGARTGMQYANKPVTEQNYLDADAPDLLRGEKYLANLPPSQRVY